MAPDRFRWLPMTMPSPPLLPGPIRKSTSRPSMLWWGAKCRSKMSAALLPALFIRIGEVSPYWCSACASSSLISATVTMCIHILQDASGYSGFLCAIVILMSWSSFGKVNMQLALKITPQRSTQYAHLTASLAAPELLASPLHTMIHEVQPVTLAGQSYLLATVDDACLSDATTVKILYRLGAISEVYEYFEQIGDVLGPLLRPVEPQFTSFVP